MTEHRPIPGHPGYIACADGSLWSCWRSTGRPLFKQVIGRKWHRLKGVPRKRDGRLRYTLRRVDGKYRRAYGSHFVLEAFGFGRRPPGMEACHNDGNCTNDSITNLRWDTSAGNKADMKLHGTRLSGEKHPKAKLSDADVAEVIRRRSEGEELLPIATAFGITIQRVQQITKKGGR